MARPARGSIDVLLCATNDAVLAIWGTNYAELACGSGGGVGWGVRGFWPIKHALTLPSLASLWCRQQCENAWALEGAAPALGRPTRTESKP